MPDKESAQNGDQGENGDPLIEPAGDPGGNQQPPRAPLNNPAPGQEGDANNLEHDIRVAEYWLIGVGIASVVVNILIGYVYWQQLSQMRIATEASTKATEISRDALEYSNGNFDRTMHQVINQTIAQADAAKAARDASRIAKNALEEQALEFESQNPPAQISIDPYISWYYQSPKNSPPCKMGFVCALLFIHNIAPNSVATGVEVAAKIAILPFAPKVNPQNWRSIGQPTTIRYSPQVTSGTYPNCLECGRFLATKAMSPKLGTLYVWGMVRYKRYSSGPMKNISFCFLIPSELVFPKGPSGFGVEGKQYQC